MDLLWRPFDVRYKNFQSALQSHRQMLKSELDIIQLSLIVDIKNSQDKHQERMHKISKDMATMFESMISADRFRALEEGVAEVRYGVLSFFIPLI